MRSFLKPFSRWSARILKHADSPMARGGLYMFSFLESIIIPLPTDPILMGCVIAARHKWLSICLFTALASVAGGAVGWILGAYLAPFVSDMLQLLPHQIASEEKFTSVSEAFNSIGIILVLIGAFTPLPYKVIAISAGLFGFGFLPFLLFSAIGRSIRFCLVGGMAAHYQSPHIAITCGSILLLLIGAGMFILHLM